MTGATLDEQVSRSRAATFCDAFLHTVALHGEDVAVRAVGGHGEHTWAELADRVARVAAGLARMGVRHGDTVAVLMTNRPEFHVVDLAALHLGATPFSIYTTSPPDQVAHVLRNAGSRVVLTERAFLEGIAAARAEVTDVRTVVSVDGGDATPLSDLESSSPIDLAAAAADVKPDDVAVLIYTSGTTGPPKGVQLTHRNLLASYEGTCAAVPAWGRRGRLVSYLPHAHLADRFCAHYPAILNGSSVTCVGDPREVLAALPDVRPTLFGAVPRIWEKLKAALEPRVRPQDGREAHAAVLAQLGLDAAEAVISGAAPIGEDVLRYFAGIGLEILEGYGMSECAAIVTICRAGEQRIGTVGRPCPGAQVRLARDGEILVRGDMVMLGYRGEPEKTAEAIDGDGWLHTGDVGRFDDDGSLRIVDRKKELIINAAGKNMSPANIETALKAASPLIGQAVAIGDRRPYVTALLVLDPDAAAEYAAAHRMDPGEVAGDPGLRAVVAEAIEQANSRLSRVEQVKRWTLLPEEWLPGGPELTPTSKLRRKPIAERYAAEIEAMYA